MVDRNNVNIRINFDYDELSGLLSAIEQKACPGIYKELRRFPEPFRPDNAFLLLCAALENGLPFTAFEAILDRSAPLPEILSCCGIISSDDLLGDMDLTGYAAFLDRADVLALLLERGAGPNRNAGDLLSPLEAALGGEAPNALKLLLEQPELDTSWTHSLLRSWARPCCPGDTLPEDCRRAMARRVSGWEPDSGLPPPFPEPMTAEIIASAESWPLLERFCRERPISTEDGRAVLDMIVPPWQYEKQEQAECAAALAALLESCPELLQEEDNCYSLLCLFLYFDDGVRDILRPWVDVLRPRQIAFNDCFFYNEANFLALWRNLLPKGPALVLDRWSDALEPVLQNFRENPSLHEQLYPAKERSDAIRQLLNACPVRGEGRMGELSPVAQAVLCLGDAPLIESLFRPGGLLAAEDPGALTDFVLQSSDIPRANRAAALVCVRNGAQAYDL